MTGTGAELGTIEDFFDALNDLNEAQLLGLAASWEAREEWPHQDALARAAATAAESGLTDRMQAAREAAVKWALRAPVDRWAVTYSDHGTQVRRQAAPALADAAEAIILGDRLDEAARDLLLAPWLNAVEGDAETPLDRQ